MPIFPPTQPPFKNVPCALPVFWHVLTGTPGSLVSFADRLFAGVNPPPQLSGTEFIPRESPFVLISNHYESTCAPAWWGGLLIARAVANYRTREPRQVRWLMAREWWYPDGFGRAVKQPFTRWFFSQIAKAYGFVLLPPVLDGDQTRGEGVAGVRHALALTRGANPQLVGLAPEGNSGPGGALKEPPPGTGLFLLLLTHGALACLPAGWYEDESHVITVRFGPPFQLNVPRLADRHARDQLAATRAMTEIAKLLPERLRGAYTQ